MLKFYCEFNRSVVTGGAILWGVAAVVFAAARLDAEHGVASDRLLSGEGNREASAMVRSIQVDLLGSEVVDRPPMIQTRDIRTYASLANYGSGDYVFTYLRAVYFGDDQALSTTIYFNEDSSSVPALLGGAMADDSGASGSEEKFVQGIDSGDETSSSSGEQYTIGGHVFEGDFCDKSFIKGIRAFSDFVVPPNEEIVLNTSSANTYIGVVERYKERKILLEFLDSEGEVLDCFTLLIE